MNLVRKNYTSVWFVVVASLWGQTGCAQILGWDESKAGPATSCEATTLECPNQEHDCCDSPMVGSGTVPKCDGPSSPFRLDAYEVTVGRFKAFVQAKAEGAPSEAQLQAGLTACWQDIGMMATGEPTFGQSNDFPMNCVTWDEAKAFCEWDGGRLPALVELKLAAGEDDPKHLYPWEGRELDSKHATFGPNTKITPVGQTVAGASAFGQFDLLGNVREWVSEDERCNASQSEFQRGVFGGGFRDLAATLEKLGRQDTQPVTVRIDQTGFRCARDL